MRVKHEARLELCKIVPRVSLSLSLSPSLSLSLLFLLKLWLNCGYNVATMPVKLVSACFCICTRQSPSQVASSMQ